MEPIQRKAQPRTLSARTPPAKVPETTPEPIDNVQSAKESEKENAHSSHLPHGLLVLKCFMRTRLHSNLQTAMAKTKTYAAQRKASRKEGCLKLKRTIGHKLYTNKMNAFATMFICQARKAFIRKQELLTRNKGLFLKLWKGLNQSILRKQTQRKYQAFEVLVNVLRADKTKNKLRSSLLKNINSLYLHKLNSAFQTLKMNPANQSKKVRLQLSAVSRWMKTKILTTETFAFETLKRLPKRDSELETLRTQTPINDREKQLQVQLEELIRENKESEDTYAKQLEEHQRRKESYASELQELKARNSQLEIQMAQLQDRHKSRGAQMSEIKIYENIYNNFLNFVHNSPEEMDKQQLIQSLLVPMSQWNIPVEVIKMENECLQDLLKDYSKLKLKIPHTPEVDTPLKANRNTYEYLIKENSDLYGTLAVLIENNRQQKNQSEYNDLINSFVDIEDKFSNIYSKISRKN